MTRIYALLLLLVPVQLFSQQYLDKTIPEVKNALKKETPPAAITRETTSEITYTRQGPRQRTATTTLTFDEKGKCIMEKVQASCDTCIKVWLEPVLAQQQYHWKKINENQFVSDFSSKLMIELPPDGKMNYFKIMRMEWTRELYDLLLKN